MNDGKNIVEALRLQPMSEEEKSRRHILGRLYGPIASSRNKTRNGRGYNDELWENVRKDEIFQEKIKNKSLFLELGHPIGREETDMAKACACIPEMPESMNGTLYATVDILDTPNGRILKTLCDYGFVPGISSRGSGDVMPNNEVDPETFYLETWDIVQLPAVKEARLKVYEGFDPKQRNMRKALTESLNTASEEAKGMMKEALVNVGIELDESAEIEDPDAYIDEHPDRAISIGEAVRESKEEETGDESVDIDKEDGGEEPGAEGEDVSIATAKDLKDAISDYDDDAEIVFAPIEFGGEEYPVETLEFDDSEEGVLAIKVVYPGTSGDSIDDEVASDEGDAGAESADAADGKADEKGKEGDEEAGDAGDEELLESLKEAVRRKDELENEVKRLKGEKADGDAVVEKLNEELGKYKAAFERTSMVAGKAKKLEAENRKLNEQLGRKDTEIEAMRQKQAESLTESADASKREIQSLREQLAKVGKEADEAKAESQKQINAYRKKLQDQAKLTEEYRETCDEAVGHYLDYRASMLGVRAADIQERLGKSYSMDDIDKACDGILTEGIGMAKLPMGRDGKARVKFQESRQNKPKQATADGYEPDEMLYELAGLK